MTRTMYDAIYPENLPAGGEMYAGYDDGNWPDAAAITRRFPGKQVLQITVNPGDNKGVIGDGPPDNGTWPQWVQWVVRRRAAGADPTINTDAALWPAARAAFAAAGVAEPHWWIADYDGDPAIPAGAVAKQYATSDAYDTSSVAPYWPGVDPEPAPAPAPIHQLEEDPMHIIDAPRTAAANSARDMWLLGNGKYQHIVTQTAYKGWVAAGLKVVVVEYADHAANLTDYGVTGLAA